MQQLSRKRSIYSVIAAFIVIGVTTLACLLYIDKMEFGNRLQGRYRKELYDLIGNVQNLENDLAKVTVSASPQYSALLFGDIWRQAGAAADRINSLPINHAAISQTSKFLTQVSDFSYSLVKNIGSGKKLTDGEWNSVMTLKNTAAYLMNQLYSLQKEMEDKKFSWSELRYPSGQMLGQAQVSLTDQKFIDIDSTIQKHPALIYDGPFSDNALNITPRVSVEPEVTQEEAKARVMDIFGSNNIQEIGSYSSKGDGKIAVYPFYVILKGRDKKTPINIDISKNGGHLVYLIDSRPVGDITIDNKNAIDIGLKFLNERGFKDMIPTFSQKVDNTIVINYVYVQNKDEYNVVMYPDQIKVKIALDNGDIIGVEAEKYLTAHTQRSIPAPSISVSQAREKASPNIQVEYSRLVVIPLQSQKEVFCYEFVGKNDGTTYIVYINAINGNEENILQIIDTPGGQLAM